MYKISLVVERLHRKKHVAIRAGEMMSM
jgi:hypothetical protein